MRRSPQGSCVDPDPSDEGELSSLGEGRRLGGNASKLSVSMAQKTARSHCEKSQPVLETIGFRRGLEGDFDVWGPRARG